MEVIKCYQKISSDSKKYSKGLWSTTPLCIPDECIYNPLMFMDLQVQRQDKNETTDRKSLFPAQTGG